MVLSVGICVLSSVQPEHDRTVTKSPTLKTEKAVLPTKTMEQPSLELTEEREHGFVVYDISLSEELQRYTFDRCKKLDLSYELVLAIMFKESSYKPDVVNNHQCYGLMQIHKINQPTLTEVLGITDFLDPEQNIDGGTYLLSQIAERYSDTDQILMVYNCGESGAKKLWQQGTTTTAYSRGVIEYMERLEVVE